MFYPEEFKKQVMQLYPNHLKLHISLANGDDERVLHYLAFGFKRFFSIKDVMEATSLEELQKQAKEAPEKEKLYLAFQELLKKEG